ncbi:molecular chaperone [Edwardsiella ictaluri]|uniref:Fimbrial chaperone protein, putative n=2 Tax=Edwardsiella ictaluri TaxID=67780 RepID=C5BD22_EDWI9|nr:molecular chaperone [Edwardsiella ictaluri]AAT41672.1 putative fimbrial chaperone protein [Edwardsiella ictaluri]ACR68340.1 fimbrial chaperone protein, putative [Edwardsiella ictaluri 93-146]ARD40682.1 fimbrial protein [Edwardsiella ictaluri]AVZ81303.1 molecular chaperone [Edwardsiella ictaluri]EKS7764535.1 molecular chaperone [Edwardsiella ictaluri]
MNRIVAVLLLVSTFTAHAGIQVDATRVIYNGDEKSASLPIHNDSVDAYMVQTWLDNGDSTKVESKLPMVVVPPIVKLDAQKSAILRFIYSGQGFLQDQETLLWVNVQEIPPTPKQENVLQLAVRTRIKLFYRPGSLHTTLDEQVRKLRWQKAGHQLLAINDGPLHITFGSVQMQGNNGKPIAVDTNMVNPHSRLAIAIPAGAHVGNTVSFSYINDFGGRTEVKDATVY